MMMHPVRKKKLFTILFIVGILTVATLLVLFALRQNVSLFYTPAQIVNREAPCDRVIRIGGMVVARSLHHDKKGLKVTFTMTDYTNSVDVEYQGILPDLFREGASVVVRGQYDSIHHRFIAKEVLAKHDERYIPKEVRQALSMKGKL